MDKIVHQKITVATLRSLGLEPNNYQLLLDASIEPDKSYEQSIENIRILEDEEVKDIENRYDSMHSDSLLDSIRIGLSKWGSIASTKLRSMGSQAFQYTSWAIEHGPNGKDNAAHYFRIAYTSHGNKRLINLGHCLHYVADTGTPYHRKRLEELYSIPSGTPKELRSYVYLENLLNFAKSVIEDHKRFEMELSSFWNTRKGESVCEKVLNSGFNSARTKRPFTSVSETITQFEDALANVEKKATYYCKILDNRFAGRQLGEKLSREDRKFILKAGLSCLVRIGEASYWASKAILL